MIVLEVANYLSVLGLSIFKISVDYLQAYFIDFIFKRGGVGGWWVVNKPY
jgi:hypothetical protein